MNIKTKKILATVILTALSVNAFWAYGVAIHSYGLQTGLNVGHETILYQTIVVDKPTREQIRQEITEKATLYDLPVQTMLDIAECESGFNAEAHSNSSSAVSIYQILYGTWVHFECTGSRINPIDNIKCAMKIATLSGLHHWDASGHCWN